MHWDANRSERLMHNLICVWQQFHQFCLWWWFYRVSASARRIDVFDAWNASRKLTCIETSFHSIHFLPKSGVLPKYTSGNDEKQQTRCGGQSQTSRLPIPNEQHVLLSGLIHQSAFPSLLKHRKIVSLLAGKRNRWHSPRSPPVQYPPNVSNQTPSHWGFRKRYPNAVDTVATQSIVRRKLCIQCKNSANYSTKSVWDKRLRSVPPATLLIRWWSTT